MVAFGLEENHLKRYTRAIQYPLYKPLEEMTQQPFATIKWHISSLSNHRISSMEYFFPEAALVPEREKPTKARTAMQTKGCGKQNEVGGVWLDSSCNS
ncbi:hypothetical protein TNCV_299421 [Trichonephila clavipes]|nr:hypothetical protein TNCV_299421 [Trichonephila clavipes]